MTVARRGCALLLAVIAVVLVGLLAVNRPGFRGGSIRPGAIQNAPAEHTFSVPIS